MDTAIRQYFVKLSELPEIAQSYFDLEISGKFLLEFSAKYNVAHGYLVDMVSKTIVSDFNFSEVENMVRNDLHYEKNKADKFLADFIGMEFSPIADFVEKADMKEEIEKRGGNYDAYEKYRDEYDEMLGEEYTNALEEYVKVRSQNMDIPEEKNSALDLIRNALLNILQDSDLEAIFDLNRGFVAVLANAKGAKKEFLDAMLENQETFTTKQFTMDNKAVRPTLSYWLKDYMQRYGGTNFDNLSISEYITKSQNAKGLDPKERQVLEKLLRTYRNVLEFPDNPDELTFDHIDIIPMDLKDEDESPVKGDVMKKLYETPAGQEKMPSAQDNDTANQVLDAYRGDAVQETKVVASVGDMKKKFGQDIKLVRAAFFDAVRNSDIIQAIATLRVLAERDDIQNLLSEDEKLKKFLISTWEKSFGKDFALEFQNDPQLPKFMSKFLQYVLEERLKMPKGDAARVGAQIGGIYKKLGKPEYAKMAYFDMERKEFKWL